jgi:CHAD domain-containing protein
MRVAIRRLRAALSGFREILPVEQRRWACDELRWLAGVLAARNLDVFDSALLSPESAAACEATRRDCSVGDARPTPRRGGRSALGAIRR